MLYGLQFAFVNRQRCYKTFSANVFFAVSMTMKSVFIDPVIIYREPNGIVHKSTSDCHWLSWPFQLCFLWHVASSISNRTIRGSDDGGPMPTPFAFVSQCLILSLTDRKPQPRRAFTTCSSRFLLKPLKCCPWCTLFVPNGNIAQERRLWWSLVE